jgi:hypothetical protein
MIFRDLDKDWIKADQTLNIDSDKIPKTILKEWHINSSFQLLLHDEARKTPNEESMAGEQFELNVQLMTKWKRAILGNITSRRRLVDIQPQLSSSVHVERGFDVGGKRFTGYDQHAGNSQVEFRLGSDQRFGHIEKIFSSPETPQKTWVIVKPLKEVAQPKDPYQDYPDLNCQLVQVEHEVVVVIPKEDIIGHAAMLRHKSGTFGLSTETYSAVGLGTSVSHASFSGLNYD